jgi:ABC-type transport system substrate-binding protein
VARYIQLCLNELGIQARLQTLHYEELQRKWYRNMEFQVVLTEFVGTYRNPEDLKDYWTGNNGKSIAGCFEHYEVTRLIKKCFEEKDLEKRKKMFYEIDTLITSLQPGTFLFQKTAIDTMSKRFSLPRQFSLTNEGIYRLRHAALRHE